MDTILWTEQYIGWKESNDSQLSKGVCLHHLATVAPYNISTSNAGI